MVIHPQGKDKKQGHSLYVKPNKKYQAILSALIIVFVIVFSLVLKNVTLPTSHVWKDNVLMKMIVNTQNFIRDNN